MLEDYDNYLTPVDVAYELGVSLTTVIYYILPKPKAYRLSLTKRELVSISKKKKADAPGITLIVNPLNRRYMSLNAEIMYARVSLSAGQPATVDPVYYVPVYGHFVKYPK